MVSRIKDAAVTGVIAPIPPLSRSQLKRQLKRLNGFKEPLWTGSFKIDPEDFADPEAPESEMLAAVAETKRRAIDYGNLAVWEALHPSR